MRGLDIAIENAKVSLAIAAHFSKGDSDAVAYALEESVIVAENSSILGRSDFFASIDSPPLVFMSEPALEHWWWAGWNDAKECEEARNCPYCCHEPYNPCSAHDY